MNKLVLIGDLVDSKKIGNREAVQRSLNRLLGKINSGSSFLDSPYTITLGDEFQALYSDAGSLFQDIWKIIFLLYPQRARFSAGVGKLSTKINRKQAIGMDGPAFYGAREGLEKLKNNGYLFSVSGEEIENTELINHVLFFVSHSIVKWKATRMKIFNFLMEGLSIKEISGKLKISDKAVYKNIDTAGMNLIMNIFDDITASLNNAINGS